MNRKFLMPYSCDMDVVRTGLNIQSPAKLYPLIGKDLADVLRHPDLFISAQQTLHDSAQRRNLIIGKGVMIVNIVMASIDRPVHMLYKLVSPLETGHETPMDFADLVLVLISPESDGSLHLRRLSRLTRLMHDSSFCNLLRQIDDESALRAQFLYPDIMEERAA